MKKALPLIVLILCLFFIVTSLSFGLEQKKEDEKTYQDFIAREEAKINAEKRIYLTGRFDPKDREDFVLIPSAYTTLPNQMYLRKETWSAFLEMRAAAAKDGVDLKIASA